MSKTLTQIFTIVAELSSYKGGLRSLMAMKFKPYSTESSTPLDEAIVVAEVSTKSGFESYYYFYNGESDLVTEVTNYKELFKYDPSIEERNHYAT